MSILSWLRPDDPPEQPMPSIPLDEAIFCLDCQRIHDRQNTGRCPSCGSRASSRVDRWINRGEAKAS